MEVPPTGDATGEEAVIAFHVYVFIGGRLKIGQVGFIHFHHIPWVEALA